MGDGPSSQRVEIVQQGGDAPRIDLFHDDLRPHRRRCQIYIADPLLDLRQVESRHG